MDITRRTALRTLGRGAVLAGVATTVGAGTAVAAGPAGDRPSAVNVDEPRYLGYKPADLTRPYAKYMKPSTLPAQEQVAQAYFGPPTPSEKIPTLADLPADLNRTDYSPVETGYGMLADGRTVWAAVLTRMPGVTAAMWDWWFGWHSGESARYRLWHPDAHAYAALQRDTTATPGLTDRQRYIGNTSYVDELIGDQIEQLAISFDDPASVDLATSPTTTVIYGRVGSSSVPLSLGRLAHQVRPVPGGAEMRSRFYLNVPGPATLDPVAAAAAQKRGSLPALTQQMPFTVDTVRALLEHCGREMNHLASFLPALYADNHPS